MKPGIRGFFAGLWLLMLGCVCGCGAAEKKPLPMPRLRVTDIAIGNLSGWPQGGRPYLNVIWHGQRQDTVTLPPGYRVMPRDILSSRAQEDWTYAENASDRLLIQVDTSQSLRKGVRIFTTLGSAELAKRDLKIRDALIPVFITNVWDHPLEVEYGGNVLATLQCVNPFGDTLHSALDQDMEMRSHHGGLLYPGEMLVAVFISRCPPGDNRDYRIRVGDAVSNAFSLCP